MGAGWNNSKFLLVLFAFSSLLFVFNPAFAESSDQKIISIQKTVDVDKTSLTKSLISLEKYSQILPQYIQSSRLIDDNVGNMKIGLDWISIDTDIKFVESDDKVSLEVISGDFKGTTLDVMMTEDVNLENIATSISAEINLQRSWHVELLTSFVTDDVQSMLHASLNGLVEYTKNPSPSIDVIEEKEKSCIFGFCF